MDSSAKIFKTSAASASAKHRGLAATVLLSLAGILMTCAVRAAQTKAPEPFGTGRTPFLLVASPEMSDPVFEETVILMLPPTEMPLVAGVVINKPTTITFGQLFPHSSRIKNEQQTVYFGGPVNLNSPAALIRASRAPDGMNHLFENVYMSSDTSSIRKIMERPESDKDFRLLFGRAQWSVDQLHSELLEGAWTIAAATPEIVFSAEPAKIWRSLEQQAKMREVREDLGGPDQIRLCAQEITACGRGFY